MVFLMILMLLRGLVESRVSDNGVCPYRKRS
jgi:hypothetical protein